MVTGHYNSTEWIAFRNCLPLVNPIFSCWITYGFLVRVLLKIQFQIKLLNYCNISLSRGIAYTRNWCSVKKAKTNYTFFRRSALVRFYGEHELLVPKLVLCLWGSWQRGNDYTVLRTQNKVRWFDRSRGFTKKNCTWLRREVPGTTNKNDIHK